jgi:hypothetical protein
MALKREAVRLITAWARWETRNLEDAWLPGGYACNAPDPNNSPSDYAETFERCEPDFAAHRRVERAIRSLGARDARAMRELLLHRFHLGRDLQEFPVVRPGESMPRRVRELGFGDRELRALAILRLAALLE